MKFGICLESSHKKGMGHFYRMLNFASLLKSENIGYVFFLNGNDKTTKLLAEKAEPYEVVPLGENDENWEKSAIQKYALTHWLNDRLETDCAHSHKVKNEGVVLINIDNLGAGAKLADLNIGSLPCFFSNSKDKNVINGVEYLILNSEIEQYRKQRQALNNVIVTLGGSDTYGVTLKVAKILKEKKQNATIITGASFEHQDELMKISDGFFKIKNSVPSLIEEFSNYDVAITGGGVTPFEANACGLPCYIIANEMHEIENAKFLQELGASVFVGHYDEVQDIDMSDINIEQMSSAGLLSLRTCGAKNILEEIKKV